MLGRLVLSAVLTVALAGFAAADEFPGYDTVPPPDHTPLPTDLYRGDLVPEIGIGCSNPTGNSGGPNDIAVEVVGTVVAPFDLTSHWYYIFTQVATQITSLSFVAWESGPGAEIAGTRTPGMDWSMGSHTAPLAVTIPVTAFAFGHNQAQTNVGMRWGLDTNGGDYGNSYIRAPSCGANAFTLVDALGYPGAWTMSVSTGISTPVELKSWSAVKAAYN